MILSINMPRMGDLANSAAIDRVGIAEGAELSPGSKLIDVRVDLGSVAPQDCPPVSYFRVVSRERGWVRRLSVVAGDVKQVGDLIALVSTDPLEPLDVPPSRAFRVATAGIVGEPGWSVGGGTLSP